MSPRRKETYMKKYIAAWAENGLGYFDSRKDYEKSVKYLRLIGVKEFETKEEAAECAKKRFNHWRKEKNMIGFDGKLKCNYVEYVEERTLNSNAFYAVWGVNGVGVYDDWSKVQETKEFLKKFGCKKFKTYEKAYSKAIYEFNMLNDGCRLDFHGKLKINKTKYKKYME